MTIFLPFLLSVRAVVLCVEVLPWREKWLTSGISSAHHLLRKQHTSFFTKSFRLALTFTLVFSLFEVFEGHLHGALLNQTQPTKLAAMEVH